MTPRLRFALVMILAVIAFIVSADTLSSASAVFKSPISFLSSPLPTPGGKVVSAEGRWLIAHDVVNRLGSLQSGRGSSNGFAPLADRTSDYMIGRVAVSVILVESNGVVSQSVENWESSEISFVARAMTSAVNWWTQQAQAKNVSLEFIIPPTYPMIVSTRYEPIKMIGLEFPAGQADIWISDVMGYLGYPGTTADYLQRVQQYDNNLRQMYNADWAFTVFVVDGSADGDGLFAKGSWGMSDQAVSAWAQRPGPYAVVNNLSGWASRQETNDLANVIAHEIGHVFGAADEVWAGGGDCTSGSECTAKFGYLSVENQNCNRTPACSINRPDCMMRVCDFDYLCPYSAGQVGWRDSDGNGRPDPIDTKPRLTIIAYPPNPSSSHMLNYSAQVADIPYPTTQPGYISVTINAVTVQYQIDSMTGNWSTAFAGDGNWDSPYEEGFKILVFDNGVHTIYLRSINKVGNVSPVSNHVITVSSTEPVYRVRLPIVSR
jgi:hypothetical protein